MGGGPFAAAALAALAAFALAIIDHRIYPPMPSKRRAHIHSQRRRRRLGEAAGFPG
jgi:hypothetical protein